MVIAVLDHTKFESRDCMVITEHKANTIKIHEFRILMFFFPVMIKVLDECLSLLWGNSQKWSHCRTSYKIGSWILVSDGFLLLFFKGGFGFTSIYNHTIKKIDPHVLQSETVMLFALKDCFVNMSAIFACEQMFLSMLPSIFIPGDRFMYIIELSSWNESEEVDPNHGLE